MAGNNAFSEAIKAACQAATKEALNISDIAPQRLMPAHGMIVSLALPENDIL